MSTDCRSTHTRHAINQDAPIHVLSPPKRETRRDESTSVLIEVKGPVQGRQNFGLFVAILPQATVVPIGPLEGIFGVLGTNLLRLATWLAPTGMEA